MVLMQEVQDARLRPIATGVLFGEGLRLGIVLQTICMRACVGSCTTFCATDPQYFSRRAFSHLERAADSYTMSLEPPQAVAKFSLG